MLDNLESAIKSRNWRGLLENLGNYQKSRKSGKIQKIKEKLEIFLERARSFKKSKNIGNAKKSSQDSCLD